MNKVNYIEIEALLKNNKKDLKELSLDLTCGTSILDIIITHDVDIIQIIALDAGANILIIVTWNLKFNHELHMYQIRTTIHNPKNNLLFGIKDHHPIDREDCEEGLKIKPKLPQGSLNYYVNENVLYDLENNIPYLIFDQEWENIASGFIVDNQKKIYKNSSRYLSAVDNN